MSLMVERYVYKKKPISVEDAKNCMEEITRYKSQCLQDAPCLQVIEKLTRCMKLIIEEHQDRNTGENNTANGDTEILQADCPPAFILKDSNLANYNEIQEDIIDIGLREKVATIDLTEDDDVNINTGPEQINVEVEIHRAMSNLSIRDIEDPLLNTSVECSQSILNNFELYTTASTLTSTVKCNPSIRKAKNIQMKGSEDILEVPVDCSQSILANFEQNKINVSKDRDTFSRKEVQKPMVELNKKPNQTKKTKQHQGDGKKKTVIFEICSPNSTNKGPEALTANEKIVKRKRNSNKNNCCTSKNSSENQKQIRVRRKRNSRKELNEEKKRTDKSKSDKVQTCDADQNIAVIYQNKGFIPKGIRQIDIESSLPSFKIIHADNISGINTTVTQNTKVLASIPDANPTICIYNRTTDNDLSWIENIRYVREVATDEFDANFKDLKDSFWHNFDLPDNWDDKEFSYTV